MKYLRKIIFLLSVFWLTAIFLSGTYIKMLFATETRPSFSLFEAEQIEERDLRFRFDLNGFHEERKLKVKVFLRKEGSREEKLLFHKKVNIKKPIKITVSTELEDSDFYFWRMEISQGKKKLKREAEESLYLKGKEATNPRIEPEAKFIDDEAVISWEDTGFSLYWVGIYEEDGRTLLTEMQTSEKEVRFSLPEGKNYLFVAVAPLISGKKGDFGLIEIPNRELPNARVNFHESEIRKKAKMEIDVIYTGHCFTSIWLNEKPVHVETEEPGRFQMKLPEGESEIKVTVTSENGNSRTYKKTVFVDTVFPSINLDSGLDGAVTADDFVEISGGTSEKVRLTFNGKEVEQDGENRFSIYFPLKEGENEIKLVATDVAGNIGTLRAVVKRETGHEPDIRIVILVTGTFGVIFLAYFLTFIGWIRARRKRKS